MKLKATLILLFAFVLSAVGNPRTLSEKRRAALEVLQKTSYSKGITDSKIDDGELKVLQEEPQLTVLGYESGGYAVVANDDDFTAVLGYSDTKYSDDLPPAFFWWLDAMNESLEHMLARGEKIEAVKRNAAYKESVANFMTTQWNQSAPFNNLCPTYTDSKGETKSYVTGCVATAMAQILKYYEHPKKGSGTKTYTFTPEEGGTSQSASANFSRTTYDYDNMLDVYNDSYSDAQATAVATLMYHCGVSVNMNYTKSGSAAYIREACRALRSFFDYNIYIKYFYRPYYPKEEWMDIVYRELNDGCPILYGGQKDNKSGHAFVFSGYDEDGKVYVNWGWGGSGNGYFEISLLEGFRNEQEMVLTRLPNDERYTETYRSIWGLIAETPLTFTANSDGTITIQEFTAYNFDVDVFSGTISVVAMNTETGEVQQIKQLHSCSQVAHGHGFTLPGTFNLSNIADGSYRVFLATKSSSPVEDEYQPIRSGDGVCNSYLLEKKDNHCTLQADANSGWTANLTTAITPLYQNNSDASATKKHSRGSYNIAGQRVNSDYKGIVIENGKKVIRK